MQNAEPNLAENLAQLANRSAIDMADGMNEAELVVWPGKRERVYEENNYKNYVVLAIKMKTCKPLLHLVENIDAVLEKHPTAAKRQLPFSPHVTIGWLYDKNDVDPSPLVKAIKPSLEKLIAEFKTDQSFVIDSFNLSTHDNEHVIFPFNK